MTPYERRRVIRHTQCIIDDLAHKILETEDERYTQLTPNGCYLLRDELMKARKLLDRLKREEEE